MEFKIDFDSYDITINSKYYRPVVANHYFNTHSEDLIKTMHNYIVLVWYKRLNHAVIGVWFILMGLIGSSMTMLFESKLANLYRFVNANFTITVINILIVPEYLSH